jgi:uncharacterized metal-binding protein
MPTVVRLLPVVYACQGCAAHGQAARDAAATLERRGMAQMVWIGGNPGAIPKTRYPIVALDGCEERCAARWLEERGVIPDTRYVV